MQENNTQQNQSLEDYFKDMVKKGYINKSGAPLKCFCGSTNLKNVNEVYMEGGTIIEFNVKCKNKKCNKIVASWSYGAWNI